MPLSPGNIFATNLLPSPWVPLGLPGGLPPGLVADTRISYAGPQIFAVEPGAPDLSPQNC